MFLDNVSLGAVVRRAREDVAMSQSALAAAACVRTARGTAGFAR
ncbi:ribosome-binding protein aMBF1 (putative translation factor) [Rathayibacter agropyri]